MNRRIALLAMVFLFALVPRLVDIDEPAEVWDEITSYSVGLQQWYNIVRLDFDPDNWKVSPHPPIARLFYGVVNGLFLFASHGLSLPSLTQSSAVSLLHESYTPVPGRALAAVLGALACCITYLIGKKLFNERVGLTAAVILSLMPVFFAYTRLQLVDSPLVFFSCLTVLLFLYGESDRRYYVASSIALGLSLATKFSAVTLVPILLLIYVFRNEKSPRDLAIGSFAFLSLSGSIFFSVWPRLWSDTLANLLEIKTYWSVAAGVPEFFFGVLEVPIYYFMTYFVVTMPVILLLLGFLGAVMAFGDRRGGWPVASWLLITLISSLFIGLRQGGAKYILSVYPAFAILAAFSLSRLSAFISTRLRISKGVCYAAALSLLSIYLVFSIVSVHPHHLDYYNELVGGPGNVYAQKMFVIGSQGEGIGAATEYLNDNAGLRSTVQYFVMPRHTQHNLRADIIELDAFVPDYLVDYGLSDPGGPWLMNETEPRADFLVENTYYHWYVDPSFHERVSGQYDLVFTESVAGAELAWVYEKR